MDFLTTNVYDYADITQNSIAAFFDQSANEIHQQMTTNELGKNV